MPKLYSMVQRRTLLAASRGLVALGFVVLAVYYLLPPASASQGALYQTVSTGSVAAILVGAWLNGRVARRGWLLLAAGVACFSAGDAIWYAYEWILGQDAPFPSVADALYLAGYPFLVAGVALLFHWQRRRARGDLLDAGVLSAGAGVIIWFGVVEPSANATGLTMLGRVISAAYPVMDLLVLLVLAYLAFAASRWTPPLVLLAVSLGLYFASDLVYTRMSLDGTYVDGSWVDAGWILSYVAMAAAALHPASATELVAAPSKGHRGVRWRRFAVVLAASLVVPGVVGFDAIAHVAVEPESIAVFSGVITLLVFARIGVLLQEQNSRENELREADAERARLLMRTLEVAEEERSRVARDLHDGPIQALTAITLKLDLLSRRLARGQEQNGYADEIRTDVAAEIALLRGLMSALRPPVLDAHGLGAAIRDCAKVVFGGSGVACSIQDELNGAAPARELETAVYRVAREALLNARKHSSARNVGVVLRQSDDHLRLEVVDDGRGFDRSEREAARAAAHVGLLGMEETVRSLGGIWSISSAPGAGTTVEATLPWKPVAATAG